MIDVSTIIGGALGAAIVAGIFGLIKQHNDRKYAVEDKAKAEEKEKAEDDDVCRKALRYIMLYIIQDRCKEHIADGNITLQDRRALHHWHELYHDGLGGNGDADALLAAVDDLPVNVNG